MHLKICQVANIQQIFCLEIDKLCFSATSLITLDYFLRTALAFLSDCDNKFLKKHREGITWKAFMILKPAMNSKGKL